MPTYLLKFYFDGETSKGFLHNELVSFYVSSPGEAKACLVEYGLRGRVRAAWLILDPLEATRLEIRLPLQQPEH